MSLDKRYRTFYTGMLLLAFLLTNISWDIFSSGKTEMDQTRFKNEGSTTQNKLTIKDKQTKIAYLKTPKTGSSTTACIFIRFGLKNNLTIFLPKQVFINNNTQRRLLAQSRQFDIFPLHTIYDHRFFTHIVKDPAIIGQVRDPEQRFISHAFYYLRSRKQFSTMSTKVFIDEILNNSEKYHTRNLMSEYFGIPKSAEQNEEILQTVLNKINSEFQLVLVLEKFDASLVLMKRLLNWLFVDIIYRKKKVNHHVTVSLNSTQRKYFRDTNKLDMELYNFFLNELNKKIRHAGNDFHEEVYYFRDVLKQAMQFCEENSTTSKTYTFPPSRWEKQFLLTKDDCNLMFEYDVITFKEGRYTVLEN